jgi:hypothetical protein
MTEQELPPDIEKVVAEVEREERDGRLSLPFVFQTKHVGEPGSLRVSSKYPSEPPAVVLTVDDLRPVNVAEAIAQIFERDNATVDDAIEHMAESGQLRVRYWDMAGGPDSSPVVWTTGRGLGGRVLLIPEEVEPLGFTDARGVPHITPGMENRFMLISIDNRVDGRGE